MSEKNNEKSMTEAKGAGGKGTVEKNAAGTKAAAAQEKRFKVEKLRENSMQLFGITASTFDGAFYGNKETEMTVKTAKAIIDRWLGKGR